MDVLFLDFSGVIRDKQKRDEHTIPSAVCIQFNTPTIFYLITCLLLALYGIVVAVRRSQTAGCQSD